MSIKHQVVIAGGGPTGMMLAAELALAGVDVAVVERRVGQDLVGSRAGGLHARTIEVLDQRGIAERFLSQGQLHKVGFSFHSMPLDISDFPTRHSYFLGLWQKDIERTLGQWADELGVKVYRESEVLSFTQSEMGVDVTISGNVCLHAKYLVGCDGGRSTVRKAAGIDFAGWDATKSWLIAEVKFTKEPAWGFRDDAIGTHAIGKLEDSQAMRVVMTEQELKVGIEPTLNDLKEALLSVYGTDFGVHSPMSISRFTDTTRQAAAYRDGRVLLAGDAAHVHPPMGGQGLNIGVQDAVNLGWKLAQVVNGTSPERLLDSYQAERHPIAARVLRNTMAHVALQRNDERTKALKETFGDFLKLESVRQQVVAEMSGLGIRYDFGQGHPLLGKRMPDLDLVTDQGPLRFFSLLHRAKPVLLTFSGSFSAEISAWAGRVQRITAQTVETWELPEIGTVSAPTAVLVRPDGYVAWVGEGSDDDLSNALTEWFGPAASA